MELLGSLAAGFETALSPTNLMYCLIGVTLGTLIGVLPGIGSLAAVSMLLPISFYVEPTTALVMLAGVYYGAEYGGSIASILLNLPGTTSAAVACLDGYPMAQQGKAGVALFMTAVASFVGGILGIIVLIALAPVLMEFALLLGPADYFAVMVLGLLAAATVSDGAPIKGIAMVLVGLLLGCIGTDLNTGVPRFNLGFRHLTDGISLVVIAMGLFGIAEVVASIDSQAKKRAEAADLRSMVPSARDVRQSIMPMLRGTSVGAVFGTLPGTGHTTSAFLSYALEKRVARDPSRFGKGAIEGITAPESANNAACQTAFIPTLALGIPGSATMALMLGALMIHGIAPGPRLITDYPDVFWGLIASFFIGNVLLLILNIPLIGIWIRILQIPYKYLYPVIICLIATGVYSINNSVNDVILLIVAGIVGYGMRLAQFRPAPLLIGFVLGPMMEEYLRRAMLLSRGDFLVFFQRPISGTLLVIAIILLAWAVWTTIRGRKGKSLSAT